MNAKMTNGRFSWILEIDGHNIPIQGHDNAAYLVMLLKRIGYDVEIDDDTNYIDVMLNTEPEEFKKYIIDLWLNKIAIK